MPAIYWTIYEYDLDGCTILDVYIVTTDDLSEKLREIEHSGTTPEVRRNGDLMTTLQPILEDLGT